MAKKPKFKLGAEVRRIARDKMPPIPARRVIPNKKKDAKYSDDQYRAALVPGETREELESCYWCGIRGCEENCREE